MPSVATWTQYPGVVSVPVPCAQNVAICTCSAVRVSEIARISANPAWNAGDPKAGGGADRNWLAEVRNQGCTPGNCPQATVWGIVLLIQDPAPTEMVPVNGVSQPSVWARVTISAPTARPITSPAANAGCGCPGPAFACAVTMSSSAAVWPGNR